MKGMGHQKKAQNWPFIFEYGVWLIAYVIFLQSSQVCHGQSRISPKEVGLKLILNVFPFLLCIEFGGR